MKKLLFVAASLLLTVSPVISWSQEQGWCGTQELWEQEVQRLGLSKPMTGCPTYGTCDNPATRDTTTISCLRVRTIVHVIYKNDGTGYVSQATVNSYITDLNNAFSRNGTGIQFILETTRYHINDTLACVGTPYEAGAIKSAYAESSQTKCNIFISCGVSANMGVGDFPWDLPNLGVWISKNTASQVLIHEMGHCLGLWHTFQGYGGVCTGPCYEYANGTEADIRGDFCADTPPTPATGLNGPCSPPGGNDCQGTPWGPTQPENYMSYAVNSCRDSFTTHQFKRMQCWTKNAMPGWLYPIDQTPPSATVISPNGEEGGPGEYVSKCPCPPFTITWNASDNVGVTSIEIRLDRANDGVFETLIANLSGNPGSYNWCATGSSSNNAKIKVIARDGCGNSGSDASDNVFTIGSSCAAKVAVILPTFELDQNYPNPFNANTSISFSLDAPSRVELVVYNMLGENVRTLVNEERAAGAHEVAFDGRDDKGKSLSSGTYFYKLTAGDRIVTKQMVLIK